MSSTHVSGKQTMLNLKLNVEKTLKVVSKIIRGTVMYLKRRNILVKVNVWVMLTVYWAFVNAKRIILQQFEINVLSHFAYVLHLRKTIAYSGKASLNPNYFFAWQQQFYSEGKLSYIHSYAFLFFPIAPYVTLWFHEKIVLTF